MTVWPRETQNEPAAEQTPGHRLRDRPASSGSVSVSPVSSGGRACRAVLKLRAIPLGGAAAPPAHLTPPGTPAPSPPEQRRRQTTHRATSPSANRQSRTGWLDAEQESRAVPRPRPQGGIQPRSPPEGGGARRCRPREAGTRAAFVPGRASGGGPGRGTGRPPGPAAFVSLPAGSRAPPAPPPGPGPAAPPVPRGAAAPGTSSREGRSSRGSVPTGPGRRVRPSPDPAPPGEDRPAPPRGRAAPGRRRPAPAPLSPLCPLSGGMDAAIGTHRGRAPRRTGEGGRSRPAAAAARPPGPLRGSRRGGEARDEAGARCGGGTGQAGSRRAARGGVCRTRGRSAPAVRPRRSRT